MDRLASSYLHIGKNRQLFFDNQIVERVQDLARTYHTPQAEPEPLIQADQPGEDVTYFALGTYYVLRDRDGHTKWVRVVDSAGNIDSMDWAFTADCADDP